MIKEPTSTIYSCLESAFWTQRKCSACQQFFTKSDYTHFNYQLTFTKVTKTKPNSLQVVVQLSHQSCCTECLNYLQELG